MPKRLWQALGSTTVLVLAVTAPIVLAVYRILVVVGSESGAPEWLDLVALVGVVLWCGLMSGLLIVTGPMRPSVLPGLIDKALRTLVERSIFGVGPLVGWTYTNPDVGLGMLVQPKPADELRAWMQRVSQTSARSASVRVASDLRAARMAEPDAGRSANPRPSFSGPTRPHVVERGDTYWSLAARHLGAGSRWQEIRDMNLGRTVAANTVLTIDESDLRRGWTIVVPADVKETKK